MNKHATHGQARSHRRALITNKRQLRPKEPKLSSDPVSSRRILLPRVDDDGLRHSRSSSEEENGSERGSGEESHDLILRTPIQARLAYCASPPLHPTTLLSQSRKDPFVTYPINWDPDVDFLFDSLTHSFGPSMFDYTPNSSHDIFRSQANLVLADPAAFHALMIMPAINRDRITARSLPSSRTLWHRSEAVRLIKERLQTQDMAQYMSEGTLFAVMCLTGIEKQWHGVGVDVGESGVERLIVHFGGMTKLHEQYPALELALYGLALLTPGMLKPGSPSLYDARQPPLEPDQELKSLKNELAVFLKSVETKTGNSNGSSRDLRFVLSPGTAIYDLLVSPPELSGILQDRMVTVQRRLCNCVIFYLHCVILSIDSDDQWQDFIRNLHSIVQKQWIWRSSSRMLQWMMITNGGEARLARPDSAWKAFRLVNALEMLSEDTQVRLKEYLIKAFSGTPLSLSEELSKHRGIKEGP